MHRQSREREFSKVLAKHTVSGPRVSVHYVVSAYHFKRRRVSWQTMFSSMPVVIAMAIGVGFGSFVVWQTKFGGASEEEPTIVENSSEDNLPWVKMLSYDQSELEVISTILPTLVEENRREPTPEEVRNEERKVKLRQYFHSRKSPFADSDETLQAFLDSKNMKLMIAISFVESTMGKKCYYHNCSGIGGYPPNLRKYKNYAEWVRDFDNLIDKRYKDVAVEDFMGLYVQPGSPNWIHGVKQILAELKNNNIE